jgi:hypothetical protein
MHDRRHNTDPRKLKRPNGAQGEKKRRMLRPLSKAVIEHANMASGAGPEERERER